MNNNRPIGVIDSGIGGLTIAKKLIELLPEENIIYFGDNKNVPYGNKTEEELYKLTKDIIDFLIERNVKLIAVACNTISSILGKYFLDYEVPIISIIEPVTDSVAKSNLEKVGVIATTFTIESGIYEKLLKEKNQDIIVMSEPSPRLAGIIDEGNYKGEEIENIINTHIDNILDNNNLDNIILGCTHYPIVLDKFIKISPDTKFIDPAYEQALYIKRLMDEKNMRNTGKDSTFEIYTTGNKEIYEDMIKLLSIKKPDKIKRISNS